MGASRVVTTDDDEMVVDDGHWMKDVWLSHGIAAEAEAATLCGVTSPYPWFEVVGLRGLPLSCNRCMPVERYLNRFSLDYGQLGPSTSDELTPSRVAW